MLVTKGVATLDDTARDKPSLAELRTQIAEHPVYQATAGLRELCLLMEHHVFAVWDAMSLLKTLQRGLTCLDVPWTPRGDALVRRLVNEAVLATESDLERDVMEPAFLSHFELYRAAMARCGADTRAIDTFVQLVADGFDVKRALSEAGAPDPSREFVTTTFQAIEQGGLHAVAATYAVARREPLPPALRERLIGLGERFPDQAALLTDFVRRHTVRADALLMALARRILTVLCANDATKRREAEQAARVGLRARVRLLDGVLASYAPSHAVRIPGCPLAPAPAEAGV